MQAMANHPVTKGWVQCPECKGYYDPAENAGCEICDALGDTRTVCPNCAESKGYTHCEECNEWHWDSELIDDKWCSECAASKGWDCCESCGEWVDPSEQYTGADSETYCETCYCDTFDTCSDCGDTCYRDDMHVYHEELVCSDCHHRHGDCDWEPTGFNGREVYNRMGSQRKYGIELETCDCEDHAELEGDSDWGAKRDGSISGMEFVSDVLYGDDGLAAIARLCNFADQHDWSVDDRCGYHAHFDMSDESDDSRKAIALAYLLTYDVWKSFVSDSRSRNNYCARSRTTSAEIFGITDWRDFARRQHRYEWISFNAYSVHSTFEIRLHHATLDGREVCNWVRAHATFIDWASRVGWDKVKCALLCKDREGRFDYIVRVWRDAGCDDLIEYYENRASELYKSFHDNYATAVV